MVVFNKNEDQIIRELCVGGILHAHLKAEKYLHQYVLFCTKRVCAYVCLLLCSVGGVPAWSFGFQRQVYKLASQ